MNILKRLRDEKLLLLLSSLIPVFIALNPTELLHMGSFVDWDTIIALAGLLMISTGIKESRALDRISMKIINLVKSERKLSFFMITLSAVLSMFLTNDITLFLVVPLTLSLQKFLKNDMKKIIVFEALAVNVGSSLTPIGNPQNLLLWHLWGISFLGFILHFVYLELVMMVLLILFAFFVFKNRILEKANKDPQSADRKLAVTSAVLLALYIVSLQLRWEKFGVAPLFIFYLFFNKNVLKKVDWFLLVTFILMFVDVHFFTQIGVVSEFVRSLDLSKASHVFLLSLTSSQLVSNVPAAIFVSKFSNMYSAIVYGVNIGGNGIVIGSLANLIALRMAKQKGMYAYFHKYSLIYFSATALVGYAMITFHG